MRPTAAVEKYRGFANAMGERIALNAQTEVDGFEIDLSGGARMLLMVANGHVRGRTGRVTAVDTPNERSLSFLLRYRGFDYLISGDLIGRAAGAENVQVERAVGQALAAMNVQVDLLHVNHHGADNASEATFLSVFVPKRRSSRPATATATLIRPWPCCGALNPPASVSSCKPKWGATRGTIPAQVRAVEAIYQGDIVITTDGVTYDISTRTRLAVDH